MLGNRWIGIAFAIVALAAWIVRLGAGAGTCAMVLTWMFAFVCLPYATSLRAQERR